MMTKLLMSILISFCLLSSCKKDNEITVLGPPQIENLKISRDTVPQDMIGFLENASVVSFDYINEFGQLGGATDLDTLVIEFIDTRLNFPINLKVYNGMDSPSISFINGNVSFSSNISGSCCIIDNQACRTWENTYQTVNHEITIVNQNNDLTNTLNFELTLNCGV